MSDFPILSGLEKKIFQRESTLQGEVIDGAKAPEKWTKWTIPVYGYLYVKGIEEVIFHKVIVCMDAQGMQLAGCSPSFQLSGRKWAGLYVFPNTEAVKQWKGRRLRNRMLECEPKGRIP